MAPVSGSSSRRIRLLTHTSAWGGAEVHTTQLAQVLADRGHDVAIVELGTSVYREGPAESIPILHLELERSFERMGLLQWKRLLRSLRGDVLVVVKPWYLGTSLELELAARWCSSRFVVIEHHPAPPDPKPPSTRRYLGGRLPGLGLYWYLRRLRDRLRTRLPEAIVAVSHAVRDRLVRLHGYPPGKISVVHNGVDPEIFKPDSIAREAVRRDWRIPKEALVFGAVGRLQSRKGYDVVIPLFQELVARHPDRAVRLVLAGTGPEAPQLQELAHRAGLDELAVFPGWVPDAAAALGAMDIFVMPSQEEGFGIALIEAMACGCVPIVMGVGGVPEILTDPSLGWLVPPGDSAGFLRAMEAALTSSAESRDHLARNAREHVIRYFVAGRQFGRIGDLIEPRE